MVGNHHGPILLYCLYLCLALKDALLCITLFLGSRINSLILGSLVPFWNYSEFLLSGYTSLCLYFFLIIYVELLRYLIWWIYF